MMNLPNLVQTYFIDSTDSQNHAHMLHKHPELLELLFIDSGEGRYMVVKREYAVGSGDIVICNAGVLHGEAPFQERNIQTYCCAMNAINIEGMYPNWIIDPTCKPVINMGKSTDHMRYLMKTLHEITTGQLFRSEVREHIMLAIYYMVLEKLEQYQLSSKMEEDQKREFLVRNITDYIDQNFTEEMSLQEISQRFYISPSTLSHLFKRETGLSPMQYVIHRRIGEAQTLLMDTHIPIGRIEVQLGFGSSCHFCAMFKKYVGISPKEFRTHFNHSKEGSDSSKQLTNKH